MDIETILQEAGEAVKAAGLPPELQAIAFAKAVDVLVAREVSGGEVGSPAPPPQPEGETLDRTREQQVFEAIAAGLDVDAARVARVYHLSGDDQLTLAVSRRRFDGFNKTYATRSVAVLLAAGYDLGNLSRDVSVDLIRNECDRLGVIDRRNFSRHIEGADEDLEVRGEGADRTVRLRANRISRVVEIIDELTGEGSTAGG